MHVHAATLRQFCSGILGSGDLETKLSPPHQQDGTPLDDSEPGHALYIEYPVRNPEIAMASGLRSLPRIGALKDPEARIECLARFAHHELMAVELFAWALLRWPELPAELRIEFTRALADEQRHCRMYLDRVVDLGGSFFKPPYSNYFWKHVPAMSKSEHGPSSFLAAMGLTLEQANLDFTLIYRDAFAAVGDKTSADVMNRVHQDEIRHVALAARWIKQLGPPGADIIEAYTEAVPFPLSAARAKGKQFDVASRRRAGLGQPFIEFVRAARSNQNRKRDKRGARSCEPAPKGAPMLYPNVGGEELPGRAGSVITNTTAPTLRLWRMIFGPHARFLPTVIQKDAGISIEGLNQKWWPEALGPVPQRAAFEWLDQAAGVVPWISTARLPLHPTTDGAVPLCATAGVVARVHDKAFAATVAREENLLPREIGDPFLVLDSKNLLADDDVIARMEQKLSRWPESLGHNFTLKPRLGTSGRGRVPGVDGKVDSPAVRGALKRLAKRGGAILEPWFKRKVDLCAQMYVSASGELTLLGTMEQIVAPSGVYLGHRGEFDSRGRVFTGGPYEERLREAAAITATRAHAEGFHGPCGIDAFTFEIPGEAGQTIEVLRPVVEFNARFTMGTIAIGLLRRALGRAREALSLDPGQRRAFYFGLDMPEGGWENAFDALSGRKLLVPLWRDPQDSVKPALLFAEDRAALDAVVAHAATPRRKRATPGKSHVA